MGSASRDRRRDVPARTRAGRGRLRAGSIWTCSRADGPRDITREGSERRRDRAAAARHGVLHCSRCREAGSIGHRRLRLHLLVEPNLRPQPAAIRRRNCTRRAESPCSQAAASGGLHEAPTVTAARSRHAAGEETRAARRPPDRRAAQAPRPRVLAAPRWRGVVVKLTARASMPSPARVFEREEEAMAAVTAGHRRGDIVVIPTRPRSAPDARMRAVTGALVGRAGQRLRAHHRRALLGDTQASCRPVIGGRARRPDRGGTGRRHDHDRVASAGSTCPVRRDIAPA